MARDANRTARRLLRARGRAGADAGAPVRRRARGLADRPTARRCRVEMEEVRADAREAGDGELQGRALTALADVASAARRRSPARRASSSSTALAAPRRPAPAAARFDALQMRAIDRLVPRRPDRRGARTREEALAIARERPQGLESAAAEHARAASTSARLEPRRGAAARRAGARARGGERQRSSPAAARSTSGASCSSCAGDPAGGRGRARGRRRISSRRPASSWRDRPARITHEAWACWAQRRPARGRAALPRVDPHPHAAGGPRRRCARAQRGLAQLLVAQGRLDEAERLRARGARDGRAGTTTSRARPRAWRSASSTPLRAATPRRRQLLREARRHRGRDRPHALPARAARGARPVPARARARATRQLSLRGAARPRSDDAVEHGQDRLTRRLVRRLARSPSRAARSGASASRERLGAQRALAVGQVLRLVAVRVLRCREKWMWNGAPGSSTSSAASSASAKRLGRR